VKYFINLSAGLMQDKYKGEIIRIQSSHLESHAFDRLFYGLSDSLLFHLTNSVKCCIIDCSSNSEGKVIRRGIPVIKTVLHQRWFGKVETVLGERYTERILNSLSRQTKRKIDYYKKFNPVYPIKLCGISVSVAKERVWNGDKHD